MDPKKLAELKRKFDRGECSEEELRLLEKWMARLPDDGDTTPLEAGQEHQLEQALWANIQQHIGENKPVPQPGVVPRRRMFRMGAIAASVTLVMAMVAGYRYFIQQKSEVSWITVTAERGNIEKVVLPDSSVVWLNAATTLQYSASFEDSRQVKLTEGEAFFEVKRDPSKPFIVTSRYIETKVLGTSFSVKAYAALPVVKVKVATGKVQVRDSLRMSEYLLPNEQVIYEPATGTSRRERVTDDEIMGWRSNALVFHRASFAEIALAIANRYHVSIDYAPAAVANLALTLKAPANWSLQQVLDMLSALSNTHYSLDHERVKIHLNQ